MHQSSLSNLVLEKCLLSSLGTKEIVQGNDVTDSSNGAPDFKQK